MTEHRTTSTLLLGGLIREADLRAAVDAYMADPDVGLCPLGRSYMLNLTVAVGENRYALGVMRNPSLGEVRKREMVRSVLLSAKPTLR